MERDAKNQVTAARVWEHYIRGWRVSEIALELRISEAVVRKHVKEAAAQAKAHRADLADDIVQRELDHLDALERVLEGDISHSEDIVDDKGHLAKDAAQARARAIDVALRVKARRAKLLGLDKPDVVKHSVTLEDIVSGSHTESGSHSEP